MKNGSVIVCCLALAVYWTCLALFRNVHGTLKEQECKGAWEQHNPRPDIGYNSIKP